MKSYTMYADKLNKEYTEAFDQVVTYLSTETIDEVTKDEQLGDLFDLFLTAQTAGRPVKRITGGNMEYFCRSFVSEFGWKNRLLYFADYTKRVAWFLLVFSVLDMLIAVWDGGFSALLNPTDVTNYFGYLVGMAICALVGALVGTLTRRTMFRLKKVSMRALQIVTAVVAFVAMAALFAFIFNTESSFPIPPWVAAAVCCVYLGIYYLLNRKRLAKHKETQVKFGELVNAEAAKEFPKEMEKKYQKANARSVKKGKGELNYAAFLEKEERDCRRALKIKWFYLLTPPVVTMGSALYAAHFDGFGGLEDVIFFIVPMLVVECAIMYPFWRLTKYGVKQRQAWIKEKYRDLEDGTEV